MNYIQKNLEKTLSLIDQKILNNINEEKNNYIKNILSSLKLSEGKKIRSQLMLIFASNIDLERTESIVPLAIIIEMLHNATLIHDDVLDEAKIRRNQPTTHITWGNKNSILIGDYIYAHSFILINKLKNNLISKKIANSTAKIISGEITQNSLRHKNYSKKVYFDIIDNKTGALFAVALECTAILLNSNYKLIARRIGKLFGRIYQINDDLIDISNNQNNKSLRQDLKLGVITLPTLELLKYSNSEEKSYIEKTIEGTISYEPENMQKLIEKYQIIDKIQLELENIMQKIILNIDLLPDNSYQETLRQFVKDLIPKNISQH